MSKIKGFKIIVEKLLLRLKPQNLNTNIVDELPGAVEFFKNHLYTLSSNVQKCLLHYHKLYKNLPTEGNYYFRVEKYYERNGGNLQKVYCDPLGRGESIEDALSTYYLRNSRKNRHPISMTRDAHFVKVYFIGDELRFEVVEVAFYGQVLRDANLIYKKKTKNLSLNIPLESSKLPETLEISKFWFSVSNKYKSDIEKQKIQNNIKELNNDFKKSEQKFYNSIKLYQEYKKRLFDTQQNSFWIGLILDAAEISNSIYQSKDKYSEKIDKIDNDISIMKKEMKMIKDNISTIRKNANEILIDIRNTYIKNNIPINNDPKINTDINIEFY